MELKKNPSLETSTRSNLFFTGGLVVVLGLTIFAFEYKTYDETVKPTVITEPIITISCPPADYYIPQDTTIKIPITAQTATPIAPICVEEQDEILVIAETSASFPGGRKGFAKFLSDNLKYPKGCAEGTVYVKLVVDKDGTVIKDCVKIAKSIDPALDAEAIRVVRMSPKWTPALQNERPVRQHMRVPVKFKLTK